VFGCTTFYEETSIVASLVDGRVWSATKMVVGSHISATSMDALNGKYGGSGWCMVASIVDG